MEKGDKTFKTDPSIQEPVMLSSGMMSVHPHFISSNGFRAVLSGLSGDRDRLHDVLLYLVFVHSPTSIYKQSSKKERLELMIAQQEIGSESFLRMIEKTPGVDQLVEEYLSMTSTPAARLQESLMSNVDRFIREISSLSVQADNVEETTKLVEVGIRLNDQLQKVKAMLNEERTIRMRGDYEPALFEGDRDAALRMTQKIRGAL